MAAVQTAQVYVSADEGAAERIVLYRIRNVTSGDTFDVSGKFARVTAASFITAGSRSDVVTAAGVAGTVLTLTLAGLANDTVYCLVKGESAT